MAHRFCPHPILSRRKNATSSRRPLSLRLSVRKRTTLCTHRLSHQSQALATVPKDVIVPAPSPAPVPALAFKKNSVSLLTSSPKPRHRARWPRRPALRKVERNTMFVSPGAIHAAATLRELDPRQAEQRRGDEDVEDSEEEDDGGMLVDQEIGADAMTAFADPRLVLQVTRADMCLPGDAPRLQGLCSRAIDLPVKDMMREELEQWQFNGMGNARSSMKAGIWTWIRTLGTKTEPPGGYRTSSMKTTISSGPRIASRKPHLRAIYNGKFERSRPLILAHSVLVFSERKRDKYVSAELQERRKPRRKRLRELERITDAVAVVDPFTPKKRCGKTAHRATRQAAASVSLEKVVGHIRRFEQDLGSAPTLSLPPTARHTRNSVLSGAHAFSLKSHSEGKNATRFTRLIETTLGDVWVDERNVAWVLAKPPPPPHGGGGAGEREGKGGEGDPPAGWQSHRRGRRGEQRAALRKSSEIEIEIESVQTNPLALLLLRKLASEDANIVDGAHQENWRRRLEPGVKGWLRTDFASMDSDDYTSCFFWERMLRFESAKDAAETAALECGTRSTGFAQFGFFVRTAANGDQEGEGQGDGRVLDCASVGNVVMCDHGVKETRHNRTRGKPRRRLFGPRSSREGRSKCPYAENVKVTEKVKEGGGKKERKGGTGFQLLSKIHEQGTSMAPKMGLTCSQEAKGEGSGETALRCLSGPLPVTEAARSSKQLSSDKI
ncbi:hypothetical protein EDB85DRAFT_2278053 [Lactarius pseudohatsudake]|nr:hypothetical protein EDB85DRAFT_2278053 [Lactarius pseudohatsudake]